MVAAAGVRTSQARVFAVMSIPAASAFVSQARVQTVASQTVAGVRISQARANAVVKSTMSVRASQARVLAVCRGRVSDPKIRAWTFSLDSHDFYVLRLGNTETLLYDRYAEQWYVWGSGNAGPWKAFTGQNWQGGNKWTGEGSNVLVGDDGNGALYFLDPSRYYDDDSVFGEESPREFMRVITGQVSVRGIDSAPCYGVQLIGAVGEQIESALTGVTLYTSDDQGHTWDEHETITVANAAYTDRIEWWSLGSFDSPGRLFKVVDYGALPRIDHLDMMDDPDADNG